MGDTHLEAAAAALRAELAGLENRSRLVRDALAGIEALLGDQPSQPATPEPVTAEPPAVQPAIPEPATPEPAGPTERPTHTRDAIVAVMADQPEAEWSPQSLTEELERRGWGPDSNDPVQAVRAATSRLARDHRIERIRKGAYRIASVELAAFRDRAGADAATPRVAGQVGSPAPPSEPPPEPPPIVGYGSR